GKTSAIATSLIGPLLVDRALTAAPVPRPPQPTRATWIVLFSPAWTCGIATPARADATAIWPDFFISSRRDRPLLVVLFMDFLYWLVGTRIRQAFIQFLRSGAKVNRSGPNSPSRVARGSMNSGGCGEAPK